MDFFWQPTLVLLFGIGVPILGGLIAVLLVKVIPRGHVAFLDSDGDANEELKMVNGTVFRWRNYKKIKWTHYNKNGTEIQKQITSLPLKTRIELPAISLLSSDGYIFQAYASFTLKVIRPLDAVSCVDDIPSELYKQIKYQLENLYSYKTFDEIERYAKSYTTVLKDLYTTELIQLISKWGLEMTRKRLTIERDGEEWFPDYPYRLWNYCEGIADVKHSISNFEKSEAITTQERELAGIIGKLVLCMTDRENMKIAMEQDRYGD